MTKAFRICIRTSHFRTFVESLPFSIDFFHRYGQISKILGQLHCCSSTLKINYITAVLFRNSSRQESFTFCDSIFYSPDGCSTSVRLCNERFDRNWWKRKNCIWQTRTFIHFRFSRSLRDSNKLISETVVVLALIFLKV